MDFAMCSDLSPVQCEVRCLARWYFVIFLECLLLHLSKIWLAELILLLLYQRGVNCVAVNLLAPQDNQLLLNVFFIKIPFHSYPYSLDQCFLLLSLFTRPDCNVYIKGYR